MFSERKMESFTYYFDIVLIRCKFVDKKRREGDDDAKRRDRIKTPKL